MSKLKLILAVAIGALTQHVPDLLALLHWPNEVKYAIGSVVLAVAYALNPASKPADSKAGARGFIGMRLQGVIAGLAIVSVPLACALFESAKKDPAAAVATASKAADAAKAIAKDDPDAALKAAQLACLGCVMPDLPKEAEAACVRLDPVCIALAGVPDAGE